MNPVLNTTQTYYELDLHLISEYLEDSNWLTAQARSPGDLKAILFA